MNKSGMGTGSASIILVFAVLCLTIFSLISLTTANANQALTERQVQTVTGYYQADTLAERVLSQLLALDEIPASILGVDITVDGDGQTDYVAYTCPASDGKALFVQVALYQNRYDIVYWQLFDTEEWTPDESLKVWDGVVRNWED